MHIAAIAHFLRRFLLAWLLAVPLLTAPAAAAGVDPALLAPLAGDDTDAKLQAIAALGQLPEPAAAAVLQALGNDQLYATADGRVLIGTGGARATDPVTGASVDLPAGSGTVTINNRLRRAIEAALAGSRLFSDKPDERLAAARRLQQTGDPARLPMLEKALTSEKNEAVRDALLIAQANLELKSTDPAKRRHAVELLGETRNAAFRPTLAALTQEQGGVYAEPDAGVREAAVNALKQIDRHLATIEWAGNLFYGISLGSVLLLAGLGL
ncbi:HEAT repeat domain-containing protein, partial [Achromobacter sp.]|uniref:HEAT repeat domain-containing protein n=1 Tax=Achromobacter sp. TaxID=134375 RepID=UPI003917D176